MSTKKIYRLQRHGDLLWLRIVVGRRGENPLFLRLLVDTGSSYTVLPARILKRIGCNLDAPIKTTTIVAAGGAIRVPIVAVPWLNCLGIEKENFPVVALNLPGTALVNGLLGMDFLKESQAIIDVVKAEILVTKNN